MDDDKKSKSMLLKLMWLDFIFGAMGIIIARLITPSNVSDLILSIGLEEVLMLRI